MDDISREDEAGDEGKTYVDWEGYALRFDGRNWTVYKKVTRVNRTTKDTYEGEEVLGYYSSPEAALRSMLTNHIGYSGRVTFEQMLEVFAKGFLALEKVVKNANWNLASS